MFGKTNKRGMAKKLMALSLAGVMMFGSAVTASAATLKDVFDAKYYAETYDDLEAAFGDNSKALYNHYRAYGSKEGRQMSALIDVVAYRNAYPDLDAAFGNNWDAYVNHYLTYGIEEGRDSFGSFDARAYADRYPDLKAAFGYDALALYKHYMNYGRAEGRDAGSVPAIVAPGNYGPGNYSNSGSTGSTDTTTPDTDGTPIRTMGQLTDPETGSPIPRATIRFTRASFVGLTEVVDVAEETPSAEAAPTEAPSPTVPSAGLNEVAPGVYEVTTDENGYYEVSQLPEGVYSVEATAPGYMSLTLNSIEITSDAGSFTLPTFQMLSSNMSGANTVTGTAIDATTGTPIANVTLNIRANWNNTSGDVVATTTTDAEGNYSVSLNRGYYTIEFVMDGYTSTFVNVASSNAVGATHGVLSPTTTTEVVDSTEFRIVLTWGERPRDLDSHLVGPDDEQVFYHVYFGDKNFYDAAGNVVTSLDVDDTSSYGPETVTIPNADVNKTYYYSVHDWSNGGNAESTAMSASGANVKVYQGSVLVKEYNVPLNQTGYIWNVFKIENGRVVDINEYNSDYNTMYGEFAQYFSSDARRLSAPQLSGAKN